MKNFLDKISENSLNILIVLASLISVFSFLYYYQQDLIVSYGDAASRLNIARKVVDNLTPGVAQLGNVWLPLPQMLMVPFIWNSFLWHSGIAGYFMSGVSYMLTVFFLYKLGLLAFKSKFNGLMTALIALLSTNFIYMQTTAMSEPLFIAMVTASTYFLYRWALNDEIPDLMLGAIFVSLTTLIRYEGYFLFFSSAILVFLVSFLKKRSIKKTEGKFVLFCTLAITGIILWTVYNGVIFGNPFYWKDVYSGQKSIISTDLVEKKVVTDAGVKIVQKRDVVKTASSFWSASAEMNGLLITIASSFGFISFVLFLIYKKKFIKNPEELVLLLPCSVALFVMFTLYRGNIPLVVPELSAQNLMTKNTNLISEYNIRYGLEVLPVIAIFFGWLASRGRFFKFVLLSVVVLQLFTTFWTNYFTIYQLPIILAASAKTDYGAEEPGSIWFKAHYDSGEVMVSALKHDPKMHFWGLNYKKYIHEGTGKYWLESRTDPQRYASWIFMYKVIGTSNTEDSVTKYLAQNENLNRYFNLVYDDGKYQVYKIKDRPEVGIK